MSHPADPVVIVGCGPAGAALGLLLARRSIPVVVLERHADFEREFRGEGFQPSGLDCLEQMGLGPALAGVPQCRITRVQLGLPGRVIDWPVAGSEIQRMRMISQPRLLEMITRQAARFGSFQLRMGVSVRGLIVESGRVVGVRVRDGEGERGIRARLVVGADGRHSVVRKRAGIELVLTEQAFDVLWTRGDLSAWLPDPTAGYIEMLPRGGMVSAIPAPVGGHQLGVVIRKGHHRQLRAAGESGGLAWLRGQCQPWLARILADAALPRPALLDVVCGRASTWSRPGVLLLGDAAHPMSPVGGQGVNLALRDVIVAANHLVPLLQAADPAALDRASAAVELERVEEIETIQRFQTRRGRGLGRPLPRWVPWVAPALARVGPLAARIVRRPAVLRHGLTEVRLAV